MPYKDPTARREYAAEWARRRRVKKNLGTKVITWEQLTKTDEKKIATLKSWKTCVREALDLARTHKGNRIKIAAVALQAVSMKRGGDRRTEKWKDEGSQNTLKAFAVEVGVHPKTLWHWVLYKKEIWDHLNPEEQAQGFVFQQAREAVWGQSGDKSESAIKRYRAFVNRPLKVNTAERHVENIRRAAEFFAVNNIKKVLSASERKRINKYTDDLRSWVRR